VIEISSDEEDVKPVVKKACTPASKKPLSAPVGPLVTKHNRSSSTAVSLASKISAVFDPAAATARDEARSAARAHEMLLQMLSSRSQVLEGQVLSLQEQLMAQTRRADKVESELRLRELLEQQLGGGRQGLQLHGSPQRAQPQPPQDRTPTNQDRGYVPSWYQQFLREQERISPRRTTMERRRGSWRRWEGDDRSPSPVGHGHHSLSPLHRSPSPAFPSHSFHGSPYHPTATDVPSAAPAAINSAPITVPSASTTPTASTLSHPPTSRQFFAPQSLSATTANGSVLPTYLHPSQPLIHANTSALAPPSSLFNSNAIAGPSSVTLDDLNNGASTTHHDHSYTVSSTITPRRNRTTKFSFDIMQSPVSDLEE